MVRIENGVVFSTEGKLVCRRGSEVLFKHGAALRGDTAELFEEVDEVPAYTRSEYERKVAEMVRERYSESEEFAIQRKMINAIVSPEPMTLEEGDGVTEVPRAVEEYRVYDEFVERCKAEAGEAIVREKEMKVKE